MTSRMLEEVGNFMDSIIYNGSLVTHSTTPLLFEKRLWEGTLRSTVIQPLKDYAFKGVNQRVKANFSSTNSTLPICTKVFMDGDTQFSCIECQNNDTVVMCQDCFLHSAHVAHEYTIKSMYNIGIYCDCGNEDTWKNHPTCTIHQKSALSEALNEEFISRLEIIIKYICRLLEKIARSDFSLLETEYCRIHVSYNDTLRRENFDRPSDNWKIDELVFESNDDQNMCLLVFNDECHSPYEIIHCFKNCLNIEKLEAKTLAINIKDTGYECVMFRYSLEECEKIKNIIEEYPYKRFREFPLLCKIVTVQTLYFISLSTGLIEFIHYFCSKNAQLCDMLSHILFKETSLAKTYIMNEHRLWKEFRYIIMYKLFLLVLYSEYGKIYITELYLQRLDQIYLDYIIDDHETQYCFVNITSKFINRPSFLIYLVENGFLGKTINCFTRALKDINISKGAKISQICEQGIITINKFSQIFKLFRLINDCLNTTFTVGQWSDKFRSEVFRYSISLIEFSYCFDDLEPLKKLHGNPEPDVDYTCTRNIIYYFHVTIMNSLVWFFKCPEIVSEMLLMFLSETQTEISPFLSNRTSSQSLEKLTTYNDVENSEFSVFNISRRFYIDTLLDAAILEKIPDGRKQFERIVKNEIMLVWLSMPSVTSISFCINFLSARWNRNSMHLDTIVNMYYSARHFDYLYMQDFTVVQILMAYMSPDRFLKYLIFNMIPKIREKVDISQSLSYILNFLDPEHETAFCKVMELIYNAMTERHLVGEVEDYGYFITERQLIHYLGCADRTYKNMLENMYLRRSANCTDSFEFNKYLDDALKRVAFVKSSLNSDDEYSLKSSYFNQVNFYYFMYSVEQLSIIWQNITLLYKNNKLSFEVSEIIELRPEFIGITDFIFSYEFFELVMYSLTKLSSISQLKNFIPTRNLMISLMSLCFIFKLYQKEDGNFAHKERINAIYTPHAVLGGKNIIELLDWVRPEIKCPILSSIINYFIKLTNVIPNTTPNFESKYKAQARASREEILKKLSDQRDAFFKQNQEWNSFKDPAKEKFDNNQVKYGLKIKLFCEGCQTLDTIVCPTQFDIFTFSTDFISCAITRWTRRLENILPAEVNYALCNASNFCKAYNSIYSSWKSEKMLPNLVVSGCSHNFHVNCRPDAFDTNRKPFIRFRDASYFRCSLCNHMSNFFLPINHPVICVYVDDGAEIYVKSLVNQLFSLNESGVLQEPEISLSESFDRKLCQESLFEENFMKYDNQSNFYLKICSIFFYEGSNERSVLNISAFCKCVIYSLISSLKSTLHNIEKYHRLMSDRPRIFSSTFVEGSNFTVSTQLSRLCYYACGLAPSLKKIRMTVDDISGLLTPLYFERLRKFRDFLKIFDISEPQSEDLNIILNIDHFEEFCSVLMTVSAIINLNSKAQESWGKNWEVSLVHMFYLLIVFNVFYDFNSRNNLSPIDICDDYDLENVNSLWQIYASLFSPHSTLDIDIQRNLYELYLFNTLPFIRKVSILFYQLFNWNSELLTGNDSLYPSVELILLLKYLKIPENPLTAWTLYESSFTSCLKKYFWIEPRFSVISNLIVPNMYSREQYLKNKFGLFPLPSNYTELLIENQKFRCDSCNHPAKSSLKCLICGMMIPFRYDCHCKEPPSMSEIVLPHIIKCDGTLALFLQINPPLLVFYRLSRKKYLNFSIYQDAKGGSISHCSLRLSEERYRRLDYLYQKDWLESISTYIPED